MAQAQSASAAKPVGNPAQSAHPTHPAQEAAAGDALFWQGDFAGAWRRYREAVRLGPTKPDYHWRLGLAAWKSGRDGEVEGHLLEAIRLAPGFATAHEALAQWHMAMGRMERALAYSETAYAADPWDRDIVISRAIVLFAARQERQAWELIQPLLKSAAATVAGTAGGASATVVARLAVLYGKMAPFLGKLSSDSPSPHAGSFGPGFPTPTNEIQPAQTVHHAQQALSLLEWSLRSPQVPASQKPPARFAAVTLLERAGRCDEAFEQAGLAKAATRPPFDPLAHAEWVSRQMRYFTAERLRCLPRASVDSSRVVLIVGMPRSGTSLVEQILASHPAVFGAGELRALGDVRRSAEHLARLGRAATPYHPYPDCLDGLSLRDFDDMARQYLSAWNELPGLKEAAASAAAKGTTLLVTDKMPLNSLVLGLAQVLLPGCRVIHCVRSPLDTCLSCYLTDFAAMQPFSHDLRHLGAFYRMYRQLMGHWRKVLTLPMLDVRYEDLVLDVRSQGKRVLDFLGLPWDERCARFYENRRPVSTASREQVRRPPYLSSVGRWRHYEKYLSPLIEALGGHDAERRGAGAGVSGREGGDRRVAALT